jgi:hypothetical protein
MNVLKGITPLKGLSFSRALSRALDRVLEQTHVLPADHDDVG